MRASSMAAGAASPSSGLLVRKSITVSASRERAFQVFAEEMRSWWPPAATDPRFDDDVLRIDRADVTLVELGHRRLDSYGDKAAEMQTLFRSASGWSGLLDAFARRAAQ